LIRLTSLTRFAMVMLFVVVQVLGLEMQAEREKFAAGQGKEDRCDPNRTRILKKLPFDDNSICFAVHKRNNLNCDLVSKIGNFMRSMSCSRKRKFLMKGGCLTTSCL